MSSQASIESIKQEVLALDPDARVQLAHTLAVSLASLSRPQFEELWLAEAARRDAEMESGEVKGIPGEEVFTRIESRHAE
jgi:putative addiction module component (TIGR02574 family)